MSLSNCLEDHVKNSSFLQSTQSESQIKQLLSGTRGVGECLNGAVKYHLIGAHVADPVRVVARIGIVPVNTTVATGQTQSLRVFEEHPGHAQEPLVTTRAALSF